MLTAAILASSLLSAPVRAETSVDGVLSFSTTTISQNGTRSRQNAFNMVSDIKFSGTFSLGFDADFGKLSSGSFGGVGSSLSRLQLEPTLTFANGAYVGAFAQHASASISILSIGLDTTGAFAGYESANWGVEGYAGRTTLDVGMDLTASNYGLTAFIKPVKNLEFFGHIARAKLSNESGKIALSALGGQYNFDNGLMAYAAAEKFDMGGLLGGSVSQRAFGVGYDLTKASDKLAGTIMLEVAKNRFDYGSNQNIVTLGWMIPLGKATATPLSSIARTARGGTRAPFVAGIGSSLLLSNLNPT